MNDKFDQLAKGVAESVTRRQALKRFGSGLLGMALACFGFDALGGDGCLPAGMNCDPTPANTAKHHSCSHCCSGFGIDDPDGSGQVICQ